MKRRIEEIAAVRALKVRRVSSLVIRVDITLTVFGFLIGQAVKLVGQRAQRFGEQAQLRDAYGELAGLGLEQRAFCTENVAQIVVAEGFANARRPHRPG